MKPLIAITPATDGKQCSLNRAYCTMIESAGGIPIILPYLSGFDAHADMLQTLSSFDGLLLSGGGDIHGKHFGEPLHPKADTIHEDRDTFEIALCRAAFARDIPIFGICRGLQILNVALGGGIHQHIEGHLFPDRRAEAVHSVTIRPHTLLHDIFRTEAVRVNSVHHQAVAHMGVGLTASATAAIPNRPGLIAEAVEHSGKPFVLGVQWHPEILIHAFPEQLKPAQAFVSAAKK